MGMQAQQSDGILLNIRKGLASFYHKKFEGKKTASGEVFDNRKFTAASSSLQIGSYVKVTNLENGEVVYVRINDRMPKRNGRLIDLARVAARKLEFDKKGIANVKVEPVTPTEGERAIAEQRSTAVANNEL